MSCRNKYHNHGYNDLREVISSRYVPMPIMSGTEYGFSRLGKHIFLCMSSRLYFGRSLIHWDTVMHLNKFVFLVQIFGTRGTAGDLLVQCQPRSIEIIDIFALFRGIRCTMQLLRRTRGHQSVPSIGKSVCVTTV